MQGLPLSGMNKFEGKNETKVSYTIFTFQFWLFLEMEGGPGNWLRIISQFFIAILHLFPWT